MTWRATMVQQSLRLFNFTLLFLLIFFSFTLNTTAFARVPYQVEARKVAHHKQQYPKKDAEHHSTTPRQAHKKPKKEDPLQTYNRSMYKVNTSLDRYALKPAAKVYNKVLPHPIKQGIANFFNNLNMVPTIVNDVLQGHIYQASSDGWRFLVNSTIGLGGFIDVAKQIGLKPNHEDFGLTLASWGYTKSAYLVLPFLGPSTVRDALALPVNFFMFSAWSFISPFAVKAGMIGMDVVNQRAELLQYDNVFTQAAFDPYAFERNAYLQRRNFLINHNRKLLDPYIAAEHSEDSNDPYVSASPSTMQQQSTSDDPYVAAEPAATNPKTIKPKKVIPKADNYDLGMNKKYKQNLAQLTKTSEPQHAENQSIQRHDYVTRRSI